jgi:regulator of RNase E activity RraA
VKMLFQFTMNGVTVRAHVYSFRWRMNKSRSNWRIWGTVGVGLLLIVLLVWHRGARALDQSSVSASDDTQLLNGFRRVEVASISDALEQLFGRRQYMSHRMQPIFPAKFAGFALTVRLQKDEGNNDPAALNGMLAAIDQGSANSVWVMVVEDGVNIAGMGGLMGTAMWSRGYAGAVIDGGVRDVGHLRKIGFPVYALGIVPSTSVHHYRFAAAHTPLVCDGVEVKPGDIVAADGDGVVVVPRAQAAEVLAKAQQLDIQEHSMYGYIEKYKSIVEAVKQFGRL